MGFYDFVFLERKCSSFCVFVIFILQSNGRKCNFPVDIKKLLKSQFIKLLTSFFSMVLTLLISK